MPATWWARPATNTALSTWTVTPLGDRRVEPVAAAGSLVLVVAVVGGAVVDGRLLEGARVVGGEVAAVVSGEPRPPATALRSDRWALMRSTTMNRARNTTSTAAATGRSGRGRRPTPPGRPAAGSVPGSSRQDGFPAHGGSPPPWRRRAATSDARRRGSRGHERAGHPGSPPSSSRPRVRTSQGASPRSSPYRPAGRSPEAARTGYDDEPNI